MKPSFRYISDICDLPADIFAEIFLCVALLWKQPFLHPLWMILFTIFINSVSKAMNGDGIRNGDSRLTYSLPFSRSDLWTSRRNVTIIMYLIPALACVIFDRANQGLIYTEVMILIIGLILSASSLRNHEWSLLSVVLQNVVYIFFIAMKICGDNLFLEEELTGLYLIFTGILGMGLFLVIVEWRRERRLFVEGGDGR